MITNTQPGRRAWMRKALVAPVVLGAVLFFACSKDQSSGRTVDTSSSYAQKVKMDKSTYELAGKFTLKLSNADLVNIKDPIVAERLKIKMKAALDSATGIYAATKNNQ